MKKKGSIPRTKPSVTVVKKNPEPCSHYFNYAVDVMDNDSRGEATFVLSLTGDLQMWYAPRGTRESCDWDYQNFVSLIHPDDKCRGEDIISLAVKTQEEQRGSWRMLDVFANRGFEHDYVKVNAVMWRADCRRCPRKCGVVCGFLNGASGACDPEED